MRTYNNKLVVNTRLRKVFIRIPLKLRGHVYESFFGGFDFFKSIHLHMYARHIPTYLLDINPTLNMSSPIG